MFSVVSDDNRRSGIALENGNSFVKDQEPDEGSSRDANAYLKEHYRTNGSVAKYQRPIEDSLQKILKDMNATIRFNSLVKDMGASGAISTFFMEDGLLTSSSGNYYLNKYVDDRHRILFHDAILLNSLGYLIGATISQHYGFHSGLLDATTDISIAAFFATHSPPDYNLTPKSCGNDDLGVIYRFPRLDKPISLEELSKIDYYNASGTFVISENLRRFEDNISIEESLRTLGKCFEIRTKINEPFCPADRRYELLKFPKGSVSSSRIGRQSAAVVIPDEIHKIAKASRSATQPVSGLPTITPEEDILVQQSVEDISYRRAVTCYYFRHTSIEPCPSISPEYLWPIEGDFFLLLIAYLFVSGYSYYLSPAFELPLRLDLIDKGHGQIDYVSLLKRAESILSDENTLMISKFVAQAFGDIAERLLYYIEKAASLSYKGHACGDGEALESALELCQLVRETDKESITLIAFEIVLNDSLGNHSRCQELFGIALDLLNDMLAKTRVSLEFITNIPRPIDILREKIRIIYEWRFNPRFSHLFYELYQSE